MPKSIQSMQRICGIHPSLFVGESKTVVQIARELGKQFARSWDGSCPILDRQIILPVNQQPIFRTQMLGKIPRPLDFSASLRGVAQMTPSIGQSGVRERIAGVSDDSFRQQIAGLSVVERP